MNAPCDAHAMAGAQEEEETARKNAKNNYNGGLRGGLPHGFGTKIYTVAKSWQGRKIIRARPSMRAQIRAGRAL